MSYYIGANNRKKFLQARYFSFLSSFLIVLLFMGTAYAQQDITVTGRVTDDNGEPLPGATVMVEGTSHGTTTDLDGLYEVNVSGDAILIFSFVGYETQQVPVDGRRSIDITLTMSTGTLDELVVIGYGQQERSQVTGSISSISSREIENQPVTSVDGYLLGKTSGVQVVQTTGEPGGGMSVNIRGLSSIQAGNDPLYVVDGVPIKSGDASGLKIGGSLNALADVNPNDIESIEVLKDASAASIYGSRASGGVVLITTKRGVQGSRPQINFSAYSGVQRITRYIEVVNGNQKRELLTEAYYNYFGNYEQLQRDWMTDTLNTMYSANTHWQDRMFDTAPMSNANLSISGGSDQLRYSLSVGATDQEGIVANSGFSRITGRSNLEYRSDKFTLGSNLSYANSQHDMIRQSGNGNGNWANWTNQPSFQPPVDDQGRTWKNEPLINLTEPVQDNKRDRLIGNVYAQYEFIEGLELRSNFAIDNMQIRESIFFPSTVAPVGSERRSSAYSGRDFGWINENTLTYKTTIAEGHNLTGLLGFSQQKNTSEFMVAEASQAASDKIPTVNAGSILENASSATTSWAMVSYFSRLLYDYDSRYHLTATFRRDGSSKFGSNNRFGNFPSVSVGWRISEEDFMENIQPVNNLMVRASYGLTGNQEGIENFVSQGVIVTGADYLGRGGIRSVDMPNQELAWESTRQFDLGVDLSMLEDRLNFSVDYYNKNTKDLLFNKELPSSTGFSSVLVNLGEIENKGFEFDLTTRNLAGDLSWTTNFNISFNRNKILSLPNGEDVFFGNEVYREGESIGTYYGYVFEGVYSTDDDVPAGPEPGTKLRNQANGPEFQAGDIILKDLNSDGIIDSDDRQIIGNEQPDFIGGFTNSFAWKNLSLDVFFNFSYGNEKYNVLREDLESWNGLYQAVTLYAYENRWQQPGDVTDVPINARARNFSVDNDRGGTSRWIDDASFLRLKTITLSYNFPGSLTDKLSVRNAQIFVTGHNLWTLTNWRGSYDPEVSGYQYPISTSVTAGIDINF
ncbi:SusC/RagA family TonB-linked outer membrane protein [Rhodohalobacter sp. 614A]|uniref:SusC/RagA family TonB-linked outer membrane protein n=1 Tax=Rhodohalobacter sp. 614A TaxID=2908649 RepID=UPI001F23AF4B|nr:TonB-dependent receptor [Rhodohalobacter sp. 614A]